MGRGLLMALGLFGCITLQAQDSLTQKKSFPKKVADGVVNVLREFNNIDTAYIEPQHYKFAAMMQTTYSFERYIIKSKNGQRITFSPEDRVKVGPYAGWSLLFLGYTVDLAYISANKERELEMSIYTSMVGVDLFYRRSRHDYNIRTVDFNNEDIPVLEADIPFSGLKVNITGINAYYILNHRKFSYPAAYSQSTCQRKSCGSVILGAGYTRHSLSLDTEKLNSTLQPYYPDVSEILDKDLYFHDIHYTDASLSAGYAYNWVFSRNWLANASLSAALGYKHAAGDFLQDAIEFRDFSFSNFNFDGVGRFALVWNNSKWYFGSSAVIHTYNYKKSKFETTNYFGNVNVYIGLNFGRKKGH